MDPEYVRRRLRLRADDVHRSLLLEYGETPERERTVEREGAFPTTPDDLPPWATVTLLTDPDRERALLVETERGWEPPGARGDPEESVETTARRGAVEAVGADPTVADLVLLERLSFDYGREDGLTAPVIQAVFHGVVPEEFDPDTAPASARWVAHDALPEGLRFREPVARVLDGKDGDES